MTERRGDVVEYKQAHMSSQLLGDGVESRDTGLANVNGAMMGGMWQWCRNGGRG